MNKLEILSKIKENKIKIAEILDLVQEEKRELKNVEKIQLENLKEENTELEKSINSIQTPTFKRSLKTDGSIEDNKFSITRYFRSLVDPNTELNELEKEIRSIRGENLKGAALPLEFRSTLVAGTAGLGQEIVSEDKLDLLLPLRAKNVLAKAGAAIMTNLKGNISIPAITGSTAAWKGEVVAAADGSNGFTEVEFSPKRLTVYLAVSKLLLMQDTLGTEEKLKTDLINAISEKLEATFLGTAAGSATQPAGLFYGASYVNGGVTVTGSTSYEKAVALETGVATANADVDKMFYIVSPATLGKMKTTAKASNTAVFIADNGLINGYPFLRTAHMPTISTGKGILFGNFADFYIMLWNNLDVTVDNITGAKDGIVNFVINLYVDGGAVRSESFAKGWLS